MGALCGLASSTPGNPKKTKAPNERAMQQARWLDLPEVTGRIFIGQPRLDRSDLPAPNHNQFHDI
jgi:hypothetical protein